MTLGIVSTVRDDMLQAIADAIDAGGGPGLLRIYDGVRPATGGAATTLLAELTLSSPPEASITGGVFTFDTITADPSANASGTATWFRIVDQANNPVVDGDVGTTGADINFNSVAFVVGGSVAVTSLVWTAGNP